MSVEVYRHIETPDGTILCSRNRHDYVDHTDTVDGQYYMLDGGINNGYFRYSTPGEMLTVLSNEPFEHVREYMYRWNKRKKEYVTLKYIDNDWLEAIIDWYLPENDGDSSTMNEDFFTLYIREKQWRNEEEF